MEGYRDLTGAVRMRTPQEAREGLRDSELSFDARYLHALTTVEKVMEAQFRGTSFEVGFASPPLGGGDGWLDEAMVPHICEAAEAAGWEVSIERSRIVFTAPLPDPMNREIRG